MALEPNTQDVSMKLGVDQDTDEHSDPNGALELLNVEYTADGRLRRRGGFRNVGNTGLGARALIDNGKALGILGGATVSPFNFTTGNIGTYTYVAPSDLRVVATGSDTRQVCQTDSCPNTVGGVRYLAVVWTERYEGTVRSYQVRVDVRNADTGELVSKFTVASADVVKAARVVPNGSAGWIVTYLTGAFSTGGFTLEYSVLTPTAMAAPGTLVTGVSGGTPGSGASDNVPYDVCVDAGLNYCAFAHAASNELRVFRYSAAGLIGAPTSAPNTDADSVQLKVACTVVVRGGNKYLWTGVSMGQPSPPGAIAMNTFTVPLMVAVSDASQSVGGPGTGVQGLVLGDVTSALPDAFMYATLGTTAFAETTVWPVNISVTGVIVAGGTPTTWPGAAVSSKQQQITSPGFSYVRSVIAVNPTTRLGEALYRSGYVVVANDPAGTVLPQPFAIGQLSYNEARTDAIGEGGGNLMPSLSLEQRAGSSFPALLTTVFPADLESGTVILQPKGIIRRYKLVELDLLPPPGSYTATGRTAYLSGSIPVGWDGWDVGSLGWLQVPPAPDISGPSAGGSVDVGAHSYVQVYERTDRWGNITISPPSESTAGNVVTPGTQSFSWAPELQVPTLGGPTRMKLYRTEAGGSVFKLTRTFVWDDVNHGALSDDQADISLGEVLYTTAQLSSDPWPPTFSVTMHRNRLVGVRSDTRAVIYSNETFDPLAPQFNDSYQIRVDNDAGDPTAVASVDDKLFIFQEDCILVVAGDGPDATGEPLNAWTVPEKICTGVGVDRANTTSVAVTPGGVFFRHRSGIKVVGGNGQVQNIGDAVRDTVALMGNVRAKYIPADEQVWFWGDALPDTVLVYDLVRGRWLTWLLGGGGTYINGVASVNGVTYMLYGSGLVALDRSIYIDTYLGTGPAANFTSSITLPWYRGAGQGGMERVWKVGISGVAGPGYNDEGIHPGAGNLWAEVYTQQGNRPTKVTSTRDALYTWDQATLNTFPVNGPFTVVLRPKIQRCTAMKVKLSWRSFYAGGEGPEEGALTVDPLSLVNVRFHYGTLGPEAKGPVRPAIS